MEYLRLPRTALEVVAFLRGTPYTLHPTPYFLHPPPYTLHPTPSTLHPALYYLHSTPYTLHPIPTESTNQPIEVVASLSGNPYSMHPESSMHPTS